MSDVAGDKHCDSEFIGELSLGSADDSRKFGVCRSVGDSGETHHIVAGIKRDCIGALHKFSPLQANIGGFRGFAGGRLPRRVQIRIYNGLCPMHLAGGSNAKVLSGIDMSFDDVPTDQRIFIEIIAKQTLFQIQSIFESDPELDEVLVDVVA